MSLWTLNISITLMQQMATLQIALRDQHVRYALGDNKVILLNNKSSNGIRLCFLSWYESSGKYNISPQSVVPKLVL